MDFRSASFVLESAIVELQTGRLDAARQNISDLLDEAVRFAVQPGERDHTATMVRMARSAADGGDWRARAAKAKIYKMAGAKKAGARAHAQAHASTVNPPKYEATTTANAGAHIAPAVSSVPIKTPNPAQRKKRLVGTPTASSGFVDPHDPEVQKRKAATASYFDKWSSPAAREAKRVPVYKRVLKKESIDALAASLAFLKRDSDQ